jgi:maltose-binding protein MalE
MVFRFGSWLCSVVLLFFRSFVPSFLRFGSFVPLFFCSFVLLAACAAPATPSTPVTQVAATSLPTALPTATIPATPFPSATQTLTPMAGTIVTPTPLLDARPLLIWAIAPESQRDALTKLLEQTARSAGISVLVVVKTPNALATDIAAGALLGPQPDIIWGGADDLFLLKQANIIQPANDQLDDRTFLPATIEGATANGQRWGTPVAARGVLLLLYNRKLIESAPRTTDDLLSQARRLDGGQQVGMVAAWIEMRWLEPWLRGYGSTSITSNGTPQLDTPAMVAALGLLKQLRSTGATPPTTYADGARLFRNGKAAFAIDGDWSLPEYRTYSDTLDLGYAPLPTISATGRAALAPIEGVYIMYSSSLNGSRLAQGHRLGIALTQPIAQTQIAHDLGYLPALRAALRTQAVMDDPALAAAAAHALAAPGIPPQAGLRCAWAAGEQVLPQLLLGELNAEQAATRLQNWAKACAGE